jgi:DUF1680 family protein
MPVERIHAHPAVAADAGCVALQRGPLVYCLEEADNPVALHQLELPRSAPLHLREEAELLGGLTTINGTAYCADDAGWDGTLYRPQPPELRPMTATAIPYHAWDNRGRGQMRVWLRESDGGDNRT